MQDEGHRIDGVLDALSDQRRRHVLYYLREHDGATLDELATVVTGWEALREGSEGATPSDREVAASSLYHTHVPKLAGADLVDYDRDSGRIAFDPSPLVSAVLDLTLERERESEKVPSAAELRERVE